MMTFATFFSVSLLLAFCTSTAAAPTPTFANAVESSIALANESFILPPWNGSYLLPLSNGTNSNNGLPPDPLYVRANPPSPALEILYSHYTLPISPTDALQCLALAQRDVAVQVFRGNAFEPIRQDLVYAYGTVLLILNQGYYVRWASWGLAMSTMTQLWKDYEYVGFTFGFLEYGVSGPSGGLSATGIS